MGMSHADAKAGVPMRQQPNAALADTPAGSAGRRAQAAEISRTLQRRRAAQQFIQALRDTPTTFRTKAAGEFAPEFDPPEDRAQPCEAARMPLAVLTADPPFRRAIPAAITNEPSRAPGVSRQPGTIARPSWSVVIALLGTVAAVMWATMFPFQPDFDPREAIARNLHAAQQAFDTGHYLNPPERSAYRHYNAVLALEPTNVQARNGIEQIANHFMEDANKLMVAGNFAAAVLALESVRRVKPNHERLPLSEAQLRHALTEQLRQARESSDTGPAPPVGQIMPAVPMPAIATAHQASRQGSHDSPVTQSVTTDSQAVKSDVRESRTRVLLADRVLPDADEAIALGQFDAAHGLIREEDDRGVSAPELTVLNSDLAQADTQLPATPAVVAPAAGPRLIKFVEPEYPSEAHLRGIEGWVDVSLAVTASGDVTHPRIENSSMSHLFGRAALAAVKQWKYTPLAISPDATERVRVRVQFQLKN